MSRIDRQPTYNCTWPKERCTGDNTVYCISKLSLLPLILDLPLEYFEVWLQSPYLSTAEVLSPLHPSLCLVGTYLYRWQA